VRGLPTDSVDHMREWLKKKPHKHEALCLIVDMESQLKLLYECYEGLPEEILR